MYLRIERKKNPKKKKEIEILIRYIENNNISKLVEYLSVAEAALFIGKNKSTIKKIIQTTNKKVEIYNDYTNQKISHKKSVEENAKLNKDLDDSGALSKQQEKEFYQDVITNTYLDDDFKKQIIKQAEKEGIKLDLEKQQNNYKNNLTNTIENFEKQTASEILSNKNNPITYQEQDGLIQLKNPFATNLNETIKAPNIEEANKDLLLSYLQKVGLYKADKIHFSRDLEKIQKQFDIDISQKLSSSQIIKFSKLFTANVLFRLKNETNLNSFQKHIIEKYSKKFELNPDNINLQEKIISFLNDNIDIISRLGIYDYTSEELKLDNFYDTNKANYRHYLERLHII